MTFAKQRWARVVAVVLSSATLAALGCSLVVEFDESRIPTTDAGADVTGETAVDTGTPNDTGTAVEDTGTAEAGDTGVVAEAGDTGVVAEAGDTGVVAEAGDTGMVVTDTSTMETSAPDALPDVPVVPDAVPDVAIVTDAADAD